MDIASVFVRARNLVDEAEMPDDLRPIAFGKAVDFLSRDSDANTSGTAPGNNGPVAVGARPSPLELIATKLGIGLEIVQEVYYERDGVPELGISPTKLHPSFKQGTMEVALLIAAARQGAQLEVDTSIEVIRTVASDYKKYDSKNFTRAIASMSDDVLVNRGRLKEIRLSRLGWEHAKALVLKLGGGES